MPAMRETWVQFLGQEDPLEKGMAIHSSTFAWKIPWTEEPGRATVHGVTRHDSATEHARLLLSKQWYLQAQKDMLSFPARTCFEDMKKPVMF